MSNNTIADNLAHGFENAERQDHPYAHWLIDPCISVEATAAMQALDFPAQELDGVSGRRELHNASRVYFDAENQAKHAVCKEFVSAFQSDRICTAIENTFDLDLAGNYLRVEFCQDIDGFWLEPHTDIGVKMFTMLIYISDGPGHDKLGTDIYDADLNHLGSAPFAPGGGLVFVPSDTSYHGFERRPIDGVRKSIIINYVTDEWRAREQLAFPDSPIWG